MDFAEGWRAGSGWRRRMAAYAFAALWLAAQPGSALENSDCLDCHADKELVKTAADGQPDRFNAGRFLQERVGACAKLLPDILGREGKLRLDVDVAEKDYGDVSCGRILLQLAEDHEPVFRPRHEHIQNDGGRLGRRGQAQPFQSGRRRRHRV
jgi:hypothetical protein